MYFNYISLNKIKFNVFYKLTCSIFILFFVSNNYLSKAQADTNSLNLNIYEEINTVIPVFYWNDKKLVNFGDYISWMLVERIVNTPVDIYEYRVHGKKKKLLAIGSILSFANSHDVIWGSAINGKLLNKSSYRFTQLDVRAVRGPLTRDFLKENFSIEAPEIYGDPALLFPYFFPEFQKKEHPKYDYLIIPHYLDIHKFPKNLYPNVVYATDPWNEIIEKIVDSQFVISSSLHGIIIAEAFGIPARMLRVSEFEPLFKFRDYYYGTNRKDFTYATSVEEAMLMGAEEPFKCDLKKLYEAFPIELWPQTTLKKIEFVTGL